MKLDCKKELSNRHLVALTRLVLPRLQLVGCPAGTHKPVFSLLPV